MVLAVRDFAPGEGFAFLSFYILVETHSINHLYILYTHVLGSIVKSQFLIWSMIT